MVRNPGRTDRRTRQWQLQELRQNINHTHKRHPIPPLTGELVCEKIDRVITEAHCITLLPLHKSTHWSMEKMAAILQTTFSNFLECKLLCFDAHIILGQNMEDVSLNHSHGAGTSSVLLEAEWGISAKTCGLDDVFAPDDLTSVLVLKLSSGSETQCKFIYSSYTYKTHYGCILAAYNKLFLMYIYI